MIDRVIAICLRERRIVFVAVAILTLWGMWAWRRLPVEAYPDLGAVTVQVTTQVPGLAAEEIEQQITTPLERQLASTPGLVDSRSSSTFGLSLITLIFRDGVDVYFARQRVTEQMAQATLPAGATPTLGPVTSPSGEIYRYTLESDRQNLMQLSDIQKWIVMPALTQIPGVAGVNNFGGFTKEYQLVLDPDALRRYGVGVNDVLAAIRNNNANAGGGRVARGEQSYIVRGVGMVHTLDDMGAIAVTQHDGVPILLRDLGRMQMGHQVREGILGKDANPDTLQGIVTMLTGENPSLVLRHLHARVDDLQRQLAPMGVRIVPYIDRDHLVHATTEKVLHTVSEGVGLVFVILVLFLGSPRCALVAAVTVPLALATVFVIMNMLGMAANLFSLGAIDFGVIVDGAIVVTEAILLIREERPGHTLTQGDVLGVTNHIGKAIVFSTLIIVIAYSPLFAFEGAEGRLFRPMAFTVSFALLGALASATMLTPALAYLAMRRPHRLFHNVPLEKLRQAYRHWLGRMVDRPRLAYAIGLVAFGLVLVLGATTGREFLPDLDEGALWLQIQLPSGLSLDAASRMAAGIRDVIGSYPETKYVVTQLGRNDSGTDPWTPSHIEAPVGLTAYDTWPHGETKAEFVARLHDRLAQIPGISFGISQPIADGMNDLVGGAHSPLVLRVYGQDFRELRHIGNQIVDVLHAVPGTVDASIFQEPEIPELDITADRAAAARYGVSVSDIMAVVQNAIGDAPISQLYVGDRSYNMTIRAPAGAISNLQTLNQLPLTGLNGAQIPLGLVAHVSLQTGEGNIAHEMNHRQITIRVDNGRRPLSQYLSDAQARIDAQVHFDPTQYHLEWAGTFQQEQRAQARLAVALAVMFAVMLLLLFGAFRKMRQAVLVLGVVPLATLGGLVALHVRGETLNVATAVGFIALFGVAIQNGIIMVSNINRLRGGGMDLREAVLEGAGERFRPVLMTATVASAGMLPAALATGVGTDVQRGLATVVVGGLGIATILTLFILPTYYCEMEAWCARRDAARGRIPS
ncbi:efflux RND transporter permease subunit [Gluconacetobacter tumulisoli]|uniref:Efflux RND transporter permease subunit n=1 Tax=Gluconacetobacter tumulisoli TaxID=1286189 RepID=A0A7W4K636_9PROT|nr:CusA/CzcA family heavy metal efflux RND transporter [Gluconacetobacter tumulisoli]MBB2201073.1 efflux RND transporter permease subunit [Gluconacetobacter tumulisoli]